MYGQDKYICYSGYMDKAEARTTTIRLKKEDEDLAVRLQKEHGIHGLMPIVRYALKALERGK